MKIRVLAAALVLGMAAAAGTHAIGLGAQFNMSAGRIFSPGVSLTLSPSQKTHIAVNWHFGSENVLGLTLDTNPLDMPITRFSSGSLNFTLGGGLFANLALVDGQDPNLDAGLRIPVGLSLRLGDDAFEIFTHVAPSFGLHFYPELGTGEPFFPIALGARLWFR